MAISLYEVSVLSFLQTLEGVSGVLDKGLAWCAETGADPEAIVGTRLIDDMHPFQFQIMQAVLHSVGAIEAVMTGVLDRPGERPRPDYAGLQALVHEARDRLGRLTPDEVNAREGQEVLFDIPGNQRLFTAEGFILTFSLPNFHFHATTAYDILRAKGVPIGKRDFMGPLRLKPVAE